MDGFPVSGPGLTSEPVAIMVRLAGELDLASTAALAVVEQAVRRNPGAEVVVDLDQVSFLDSTALHAFADARAQATSTGGALTLVGASDFAYRLLQIWHLEPDVTVG
jgi:anti-sigma B factor antagonist